MLNIIRRRYRVPKTLLPQSNGKHRINYAIKIMQLILKVLLPMDEIPRNKQTLLTFRTTK
jgi:hypothetical protein